MNDLEHEFSDYLAERADAAEEARRTQLEQQANQQTANAATMTALFAELPEREPAHVFEVDQNGQTAGFADPNDILRQAFETN